MQTLSKKMAGGDLTDSEIARRIAAGDLDLLRLLMRRQNQTLYRAARSILKDDAEAEDALQEGYLLAYRAMDRFLANPLKKVPGTAMGYAGVKDRKARAELIAYLEQANAAPECRRSPRPPQ